ncbi:hypothetical protein [Mesorhizobium captivum]|uniref:hypothetical protein n=1 Tax=Mesorhizobium captivum TaxID=3072319 RepID=UPI002A23CAE9|nr:hypothetical protein [Mesorhizobium sp. VK3C]MDX8449933.1 hypothetical protein [Mesorhizobium sp. VK3C]
MNKSYVVDSVEIDEIENRHYVRVIEDGAVRIKTFGSQADAKSFAKSEKARLGLEAPIRGQAPLPVQPGSK